MIFSTLLSKVNNRIRSKKKRIRDGVHRVIDRTYINESEGVCKEKRKINFHCLAWGDYLDYFLSYTAPSLLQDGNIPSLAGDGYDLRLDIYTQPGEYQAKIKQYGPCLAKLNEYMLVNVIPLNELKGGWWGDYYWQSALIDQIERCIDEHAIMFLTPPDTIFGNRSITHAVRTAQGKNVCLAAAHPRVRKDSILTSDVFAGLKRMERSLENDELVDLAFEHGHPALLESFDNVDTNRTHLGLSIRKINDSTYSVIHNLPTVYLANFVTDDLEQFTSSWASWDRRWPRLLMRHNRLKVVGSSDLFFCVELTKNDRLGRIRKQSGLLDNDKVIKQERYLNSYVCNSFCCVWKGSGERSRFSSDELVQQPRIG